MIQFIFLLIFCRLTEAFIQYADNLEKVSTTFEAGSLSQLFIKKLLTKTCLVMEISFRLLPFTSYMELLAGLIQKTQIVLKKKAFELLAKVLRETDKLDENEVGNYTTNTNTIISVPAHIFRFHKFLILSFATSCKKPSRKYSPGKNLFSPN